MNPYKDLGPPGRDDEGRPPPRKPADAKELVDTTNRANRSAGRRSDRSLTPDVDACCRRCGRRVWSRRSIARLFGGRCWTLHRAEIVEAVTA
jgi:hypothetical protein